MEKKLTSEQVKAQHQRFLLTRDHLDYLSFLGKSIADVMDLSPNAFNLKVRNASVEICSSLGIIPDSIIPTSMGSNAEMRYDVYYNTRLLQAYFKMLEDEITKMDENAGR